MIEWLNTTYSLGNGVSSELIRSYTNDVFRVQVNDKKYILKLYGIGWRTQSEIQYEVALLDHLRQKGLGVVGVIIGQDGQKIYTLPSSEGDQYAVLFEYVAGQKPRPPFSTQLYDAFGQSVARIHNLSDDFATLHARKPLDLEHLIDIPLNVALLLIERVEDRLFLQNVAQKVSRKIMELDPHSLDWGPIHGDATLDNLHVTDEGHIIWYDFDMGGPGWRAADLQGWAKNNQEYAQRWVAFKQGYARERDLKALDLKAAPYLAVAWLIWALQIDLERRILVQGNEKVQEYLQRQLDAIRRQTQLAFK